MEKTEILSHVDHTQLKAFATWEDIRKLCDEAVSLHTASVCVPPCYIKRIRDNYPQLDICTVVGFPLGYSVTEACEMCGFNDYSNYLKAFTKAVGISPKKYAQFNS